MSGEYGIGYTIYNEKFYFDLEDYDKIKNYYWRVSSNEYIVSGKKLIHRIIMNCPKDKVVDHINAQYKNDNRKSNLQICSTQQNISKKSKMKINTSGIIGVSWSNKYNKWLTRLYKYKKCVYLKYFDNKEDAIIARLNAEKIYYGEFSPQKHLFGKYNI